VRRVIDRLKDDGTKVLVHDYTGCSRALRYYEIEGGGHRWAEPNARNGNFVVKKLGKASHEVSTVWEIIRFFGLTKM